MACFFSVPSPPAPSPNAQEPPPPATAHLHCHLPWRHVVPHVVSHLTPAARMAAVHPPKHIQPPFLFGTRVLQSCREGATDVKEGARLCHVTRCDAAEPPSKPLE